MLQQISDIEVHSRAAIPALKTEVYDGWYIRFARNHTRRANSVNVVKPGKLPLNEKIDHCEAAYAKEGQPCHFRLTPLADAGLDEMLGAQGYGYFGETEVRVQKLDAPIEPDTSDDLVAYNASSDFWLKGVAALAGQDKAKQAVFREMLSLIDLDIQALAILRGKQIVACGMGVQSASHLGLFEFATDPKFRRRGFAARIVRQMLSKATAAGVSQAYLQVVVENETGRRFWNSMGFQETLYRYHYRTKL